jgi:hypothetical protein
MYGEDLHVFGLENLRRCLGWVLMTDEILAALKGAGAGLRAASRDGL